MLLICTNMRGGADGKDAVAGMKEKETDTMEALGKNSQVGRLRKIVRETYVFLAAGGLLLVLLLVASIGYISASQDQLKTKIGRAHV